MLTHVCSNKNINSISHAYSYKITNIPLVTLLFAVRKLNYKSQECEDPLIFQVVLKYGTECICVCVLYAHCTCTCQFNKYMSLTIGSKLNKVVH